MIMAISASATPGHIQKELTVDLTLGAQMLVPKASGKPRKSGPPPPGLLHLPVPSCALLLPLLRVEFCSRLWGTHGELTTHRKPEPGCQQLWVPCARVKESNDVQADRQRGRLPGAGSKCLRVEDGQEIEWGRLISPLQRACWSSPEFCRGGRGRALGHQLGQPVWPLPVFPLLGLCSGNSRKVDFSRCPSQTCSERLAALNASRPQAWLDV